MNSADRDLQFHQARKCYRNIQSLIKDQTRVKNRAEKLIYESFPELLGMTKSGSLVKWMIKLLARYPSAQAINRASIKSLVKIKGITVDKAERIRQKAAESVGAPTTLFLEHTSKSYVLT